jgi:hypothetical protein
MIATKAGKQPQQDHTRQQLIKAQKYQLARVGNR